MKRVLLSLLTVVSIQFCNAQNAITAESEITDVSVYTNGAQITRKASVSLKNGENIIKIKGLAQDVNPNSLNVEGNSNYLIKSVKHERNFQEDATDNAEILKIQDEILDVDFKISTRTSLERVYVEEKNLLLANKSIKGDSQILLAEDLREMAAFYREHLEELEYKLLELAQEKRELHVKKNELNLELNQSRGRSNLYSSEMEIVLTSSKNQTTDIEVSYVVNSAGWYATYDVRTSEADQPVQLVYKANISQTTGVDWNDVKITLSSGNPMVTGNKPTLNAWYISVYNLQDNYGSYQAQKQSRKRDKAEADYRSDNYEEEKPTEGFYNDDIGYTSQLTQNVEALTSTEFIISIPYDIPSDGEAYEVEIQRNEIKSTYSYYAAPSVDNTAYLLARLTDWSELSLLPGDANIFYQSSFVGSSFLDPYSTDDTLDVSLGKDRSIIISREKIEEFCKSNTFGPNKKTNRAYKITVKNNKSIPVQIKMVDQIPISQRNDIDVTVSEIKGGTLDEKTGIITWELDLSPGESKEVTFQFEVKHPKKIKLARF